MILVLKDNKIVLQASSPKQLKKRWHFPPDLAGLTIFEVKGGKYKEIDRIPVKFNVVIQLQRLVRTIATVSSQEEADAVIIKDANKRGFKLDPLANGNCGVFGQPYINYNIVPIEWEIHVPDSLQQQADGTGGKAT